VAKICWLCGGEMPERVIEKLGTPIAELGCSMRLYNALNRRGIEYVEQVLKMSDNELLRLRNFGAGCLNELTEKIKIFGFDKN